MGQEQSQENGSGLHDSEEHGIDVQTLSGYRVMKVFRGSPAARSGLAPFEDFIVAVDGTLVEGDGALSGVLEQAEGMQVTLSVWNCVDEAERDVAMTPAKWNGPGLLGAAVRYEAIKGATDYIWRVLDVKPNSPADDAGLVPRSDYVVGTTAEVFRSDGAFSKLVRRFSSQDT